MFRKISFPEEQRFIDAIRSYVTSFFVFVFFFLFLFCVLYDEFTETCQNACINFSISDWSL
jgi:hypothetical protein